MTKFYKRRTDLCCQGLGKVKGDCGRDITEQYEEGPVVIKPSYILTMVADA